MSFKTQLALIKGLLSFKTGTSIKDIGIIIKEVEKVSKFGEMGRSMKATGRIILHMDSDV